MRADGRDTRPPRPPRPRSDGARAPATCPSTTTPAAFLPISKPPRVAGRSVARLCHAQRASQWTEAHQRRLHRRLGASMADHASAVALPGPQHFELATGRLLELHPAAATLLGPSWNSCPATWQRTEPSPKRPHHGCRGRGEPQGAGARPPQAHFQAVAVELVVRH